VLLAPHDLIDYFVVEPVRRLLPLRRIAEVIPEAEAQLVTLFRAHRLSSIRLFAAAWISKPLCRMKLRAMRFGFQIVLVRSQNCADKNYWFNHCLLTSRDRLCQARTMKL
jgi:hypothetical protein